MGERGQEERFGGFGLLAYICLINNLKVRAMRVQTILSLGLSALLALGCREKINSDDTLTEVATIDSQLEGDFVTLSGRIASSVDITTVPEAGFLISDNENVPEGSATKFSDAPTDHDFSIKIKLSEFGAVRGVVYYYKAFADLGGKTVTGKAKSFYLEPIKVTGIKITPSTYGGEIGKSIQLMASITPSNATDKSLTWTSSVPEIATVDENGLVKMLKKGETVITATSSGSGVSATCTITVRSAKPSGAVDLGLSVYWAEKNLGASSATQAGSRYAWGETSTKTAFWKDNYKYGSEPEQFSKYNSTDKIILLDDSDDAASVALKGNWRMPTSEDVNQLLENCTRTKESDTSVRFTSKINGNSIILTIDPNTETGVYGYWLKDRDNRTLSQYFYSYQWEANSLFVAPNNLPNIRVEGGTRYGGKFIRPVSGD